AIFALHADGSGAVEQSEPTFSPSLDVQPSFPSSCFTTPPCVYCEVRIGNACSQRFSAPSTAGDGFMPFSSVTFPSSPQSEVNSICCGCPLLPPLVPLLLPPPLTSVEPPPHAV